jgi:integrase
MFDTMATVEKRGNTYRITVSNGYDVTGKQIREKTTFTPDENMTEKQQKKALDDFVYEFEKRVKNGKYLNGEKMTFNEFYEYWLKEYADKHLEKTTLQAYKAELNQKIIPAIGHLKIAKIKPTHLQSFYNNLMEDGVRKDGKEGGYSPVTIKKDHAIISGMLKLAVLWQLIESNPCDRVAPPKEIKEAAEDVKHLELDQAETFLNALEKEYATTYKSHDRIDDTGKKYHVPEYTETRDIPLQFRVFFNFALFGGLRRGELIALTWDDVDFKNCTIDINKSTGYVDHKQITKMPKSKSSIRTVVVPDPIMKLAERYKKEQLEYRLSLGDQWEGNNHIFIQASGKQMNLSTPNHTFHDIIDKYNSTVEKEEQKLPHIPLHGLRHTSATFLISENIDIKTVSVRLGHAQTSTTVNIYAKALKKLDKKASNALDNLLIKKA